MAYNMNTGDIVWQKTHGSTPDDIRNHPLLKDLDLPRTGQTGSPGTLVCIDRDPLAEEHFAEFQGGARVPGAGRVRPLQPHPGLFAILRRPRGTPDTSHS